MDRWTDGKKGRANKMGNKKTGKLQELQEAVTDYIANCPGLHDARNEAMACSCRELINYVEEAAGEGLPNEGNIYVLSILSLRNGKSFVDVDVYADERGWTIDEGGRLRKVGCRLKYCYNHSEDELVVLTEDGHVNDPERHTVHVWEV